MKRLLLFLLVIFALVSIHVFAQNAAQRTVNLAPSNPQLTAIDPFPNGLTPSNPLKPARPFWYSVDARGLTIVGLRTETTGALMVGGPPINVVENQVVGYVPWPDAIAITQPDGEVPTDPTIAEDHDKFAWRNLVGGVWEPVGIAVSYPTEEALASNSETPPTYVYVVMKHSGYQWQSTPLAELPAGRDPNLRDRIAPQPDLTKDGSLLVQIDVSQPNYPVDLFPTGAPIGAGLLGHNAGQPAFDPALDMVYVGSMPTLSLPTTPAVPNDLTSFVSAVTLAPAELPAPGEGAPAPVTVTVLCGPEHPDIPLLAGFPESWACIAEGGEGPFQWTFTNLPIWLTAHIDPITGQGDGILYGTPPAGNYTFQAHVDDYATTPPGTGDATISLIVTADPTAEYENGELEWEVGTPAAVAIEGTPKGGGDPCALTPTLSPGSLVPAWVDVKQISGRTINNTAVGGPVENTIGCVIMGTPPISGERYEFQMPNLQFVWPSQTLPIIISGQVAGPYTFDPLPKGVGLSGLAWHQIDKIHDASTEADLLNREFFGVEPYTGQMYRIVPSYATLEAEGTIVPPPALEGELDEVEPYADILTPLLASRPDIATALAANPNLKVKFGDIAVEANPNAQVFVTASEISDPTGVDPTFNPIGGPAGSSIPVGALIKVSGTRDAQDPATITPSAMNAVDLPGVQGYFLGLDSDLRPAILGSEPGQVDHGLLWVTGTTTPNVMPVDTTLGVYTQLLTVLDASSVGGVSVSPTTRSAYVASPSLQSVTIFGPGTAADTAPVIWSANSTAFTVGTEGWFKVTATGSPMPSVSYQGALPDGVTFTTNSNGTAILAGTPALGTDRSYTLTITAANAVSSVTQAFTLTVQPGIPPVITSAPTTTFTVGVAGSFLVTATGSPKPALTNEGMLPSGVTFTDNGNGTATLSGSPALATEGNYTLTIAAVNGVGGTVTQAFVLVVNPGIPPTITSASTTTFTVGSAGSFTLTATGSPTPVLSFTGNLPNGVVFTPNGDGTATLAGTPAVGTQASYSLTITATNGVGSNATQPFTLVVNEPPPSVPVITSANATTFTVGSAGSFTVIASGWPTPILQQSGALPNGVTFTDHANGEATLAGTPAPGTEKSYTLTIMAWNAEGLDFQSFTLTVNATSGTAPAITSANSTTFVVGSAGSFSVTATGSPTPQLIALGALPNGVTYKDNGNGTGTFAGTPAVGTERSYAFTITAANGVPPNAEQSFTLVVNAPDAAPMVTVHPLNQTVTEGLAATFTAGASGNPTPTVQWQVSTNGVDWSNLTGATSTSYSTGVTTVAMSGYRYRAAFTNRAGTATSGFATLTVNAAQRAPEVTSHPSNQTVIAGQAATFTAAASGNPTPNVQWQVSTNGGSTWSTLAGAITASYTTPGTAVAMNGYRYRAVFTNAIGSSTSNAATLTVNASPRVTVHPSNQTVNAGQTATFTAAASGNPAPTVQWQLSTNGGLSWSDISGATSTSYSTGATTVGMNGYRYRAVFNNSVGTATSNPAILTVNAPIQPLTIVTTSLPNGTVNQPYSATLQAAGGTQPYSWRVSGNLPRGLRLSQSGVISGTPSRAGSSSFTVRITDNARRSASKSFTLTIVR